MKLKKRATPEEEAAFIAGAKADQAELAQISTIAVAVTQTTDISNLELVNSTPAQLIETESETNDTEEIDPYLLVHRTEWPILPTLDSRLTDGRDDLDKAFIMRMKENLWCSIDRHCKALGIDKAKWIRHAILYQLATEQQHFIERSKT